eukprot:jgi/Ulvmu1/1566/UM110_0029.1
MTLGCALHHVQARALRTVEHHVILLLANVGRVSCRSVHIEHELQGPFERIREYSAEVQVSWRHVRCPHTPSLRCTSAKRRVCVLLSSGIVHCCVLAFTETPSLHQVQAARALYHKNILPLVGIAALLSGADARKNFDDVKKDLDDNGSGSSTSGYSGSSGSGHFGAAVECSSEAYAATYTDFVDSYIEAVSNVIADSCSAGWNGQIVQMKASMGAFAGAWAD